jgi:2-polyprenyl-3-methyl-5-hydroxy-6-metoxy-1,4-benzoquinol methylase
MSFYSDFTPYYELVFPFRKQVYSFLKEYAGRSGAELLDAGCGPGHYCGMFLRDGFRATGIDLDQMMIEAASAAYPKGVFRCIDITAVASLQSSFQLIYSIGNVLAHLQSDRLAAFLRDVYTALEIGGCWIFQVVNWDYLLTLTTYAFPIKTISDGSVTFRRRYSHISYEEVTFEVQLVLEGKTVLSECSQLYPLTSEAFILLHQAAGFSLEGVYSDFEKSKFRSDCDSGLVMVFIKR